MGLCTEGENNGLQVAVKPQIRDEQYAGRIPSEGQ